MPNNKSKKSNPFLKGKTNTIPGQSSSSSQNSSQNPSRRSSGKSNSRGRRSVEDMVAIIEKKHGKSQPKEEDDKVFIGAIVEDEPEKKVVEQTPKKENSNEKVMEKEPDTHDIGSAQVSRRASSNLNWEIQLHKTGLYEARFTKDMVQYHECVVSETYPTGDYRTNIQYEDLKLSNILVKHENLRLLAAKEDIDIPMSPRVPKVALPAERAVAPSPESTMSKNQQKKQAKKEKKEGGADTKSEVEKLRAQMEAEKAELRAQVEKVVADARAAEAEKADLRAEVEASNKRAKVKDNVIEMLKKKDAMAKEAVLCFHYVYILCVMYYAIIYFFIFPLIMYNNCCVGCRRPRRHQGA